MHVVFVEPTFPANQREFVRGLVQAGATVSAVGEGSKDALDDDLRRWLLHYEQVPTVVDVDTLVRVVGWMHGRLPVHRLEATVEAHVLPAAQARETLGIPGTSVRTAFLCRDKPAMKEVLREAGVACAASLGSSDPEEILSFARRVGYPLVVKPRAAAGASGTERVASEEELSGALERAGVFQGAAVAVEEFIEGHEAFYDTITIGGVVAHEFITHYYPNVLEGMRTRWISPQFITTNRIETAPDYQPVVEMGRNVNQVLGIDTSATHMEWFVGPRGLRFSEIGCRPPGVRAWDLYAAANDLDIYAEWGMAVVHGRTLKKASRRLSAGIIALRPDQDGVIVGYEGVGEIQERFGEWILDAHLPPEGTPTQPVEGGFMANAWVRMAHPDYDHLRFMLDTVGEVMQVRAR
ncbi:MAG: ATP-grasp domain-containing protein [Gemmatimonadota bacterium]|jgi:formate-dependent phosphoribosylglycinamide formyltransferase (GAR transformylase)